MQTMTSAPNPEHPRENLGYMTSFTDRFMRWVQRLPLPYWLTYLLFFLLQSLLILAVVWATGWLPLFKFSPLIFLFPFWLWGPLAMITYLNVVAQDALSGFRPLLDVDDAQLKKLQDEFTAMPMRGVILSGVLWAIVYVMLTFIFYNAFYVSYRVGNLLGTVIIIEGLVSYTIGGVIYYHSFRQLILVRRTVKMVKEFNLFQLNPVYSFSALTAQTGIAWMVLLSFTLLVYPLQVSNLPILVILGLQVFLAVGAFVLPVWILNRRLVLARRKLLIEINLRIQKTAELLHRCVDENNLDESPQLNNALNGLNIERGVVLSISTWPWRTNTLTGFLSATGLPLILVILQIIVKKWLGG